MLCHPIIILQEYTYFLHWYFSWEKIFCGLFSRMNFKKKSQYKNVILFQMRWNRGTVHRDMWHWFFHSIGIWKIILHRIETKLLVQTYLWREISAHANLQSFSSSICHHQINNSAISSTSTMTLKDDSEFWYKSLTKMKYRHKSKMG